MNSNEAHTYTKTNITETNTTLPLHFWRNNITWRSTNTGMNENVIKKYSSNNKQEIILHMRETVTYYEKRMKYLSRKKKQYSDYFIDIVNDCMEMVWHNSRGYVFTDEQLKEVIKLCSDVKIKWDEDNCCYYCWKQK